MEKLDIDKEIERIIEKYELDRHYPAYRVSRQASNFIRKWVRGLAETGREVLGVGEDGKHTDIVNRRSEGTGKP